MKCSACGTELKNGRCPFCGYVPTQEDMAAEAAWRRQKAEMGSGSAGGDWRAERPSLPAFKKPVAKKQAAPAHAGRKVLWGQAQVPAPKKPSAAPVQQKERPPKQPSHKKVKKRRVGGMLIVKLMVALWIFFCIMSFLQVFSGETGIDLVGILFGNG